MIIRRMSETDTKQTVCKHVSASFFVNEIKQKTYESDYLIMAYGYVPTDDFSNSCFSHTNVTYIIGVNPM